MTLWATLYTHVMYSRLYELILLLPSPVLRLALNQSRRDLSDAQAKVNEYRYLKDNDNSMAQTAFDDLERRYERLKTEMAQVRRLFPERTRS